jgi:hypothetical protein
MRPLILLQQALEITINATGLDTNTAQELMAGETATGGQLKILQSQL